MPAPHGDTMAIPRGTLSPLILPFPLWVKSWCFLFWRCRVLSGPCLCSPWRNTQFVEHPGEEQGSESSSCDLCSGPMSSPHVLPK